MAGRRDQILDDWGSQIALGKVPDVLFFNKFGTNPVVGTSEETVWGYGGEYTFLTTGTDLEITCADNINGQGQTLRVIGLDENWLPQTKDVVLTGTTPAPIDGQWTIVHRAYQVSAAPDPVGDVYISTTAATYTTPGVPNEANLVQAYIDFSDSAQQTQQAFIIIPAGYKGLVYRIEVTGVTTGAASARSSGIFLEVAPLASGATVANPSWAPRNRASELQVSTNSLQDHIQYPIPLGPFSELTRLEMRAKSTADLGVRAAFMCVIVPDD